MSELERGKLSYTHMYLKLVVNALIVEQIYKHLTHYKNDKK